MEITLKGTNTIILNGELDMSNASSVKEKIVAMDIKDLVLDFSKVTYLDSSGIGILISLHKNAQLLGGSLTLTHVDPKIRKLFEMVGLTKILKIK